MTTPIKAVVFDLGGVVIRICRSWQQAATRAGLPVHDEKTLADIDFIHQRHAPSDLHMAGKISCEEYFAQVSAACRGLYSPDEVRAIHTVWTIDDEPGIADLIASLNDAGLHTACLSNTNDTHWRILTQGDNPSPAIANLRTTLVSHHIGAVKPDPEIYAAAETTLDARPEEILFFDDVQHNIDAARARNWNAHLIDHDKPTPPQITIHLAAHAVNL